MSVLDKPQTFLIAFGRKYRDLKRLLRSTSTALTGFSAFVPDHLTMIPKTLRTADRQIAGEFYNGRYFLGGALVDTAGKSPFSVREAEKSWLEALHNFSWLRHFSAKHDRLAENYARAMIMEWVNTGTTNQKDIAWSPETTSLRLISWLCNSNIILTNCDHEFYRMFMRCLGTHVRHLIRYAPTMPEGRPKLLAYLALSYASICHHKQQETLKFARDRLAKELDAQILPDGGHISRNPMQIVEILSLLLPFRQSCLTADISLPAEIHTSIERMFPAVRFFRMGDGNLARFNGSGRLNPDLIATVLRHDEVRGEPVMHATYSGYQRITDGESIVIMDVGNPPKGEHSSAAHAGCLSFEFSSGPECIIVNCGTPAYPKIEPIKVWRTSAAHSTPVMYETSSCRFENILDRDNQLSGQILTRNLEVSSERLETADQVTVQGEHAGYVRQFGALVQRTLVLGNHGHQILGCDEFTAQDKSELKYSTRDHTEIHFHLHPDVKPFVNADNPAEIVLETRLKQQWKFSCKEVNPTIEESIFFASLSGSRRKAYRISLQFGASSIPKINWTLEKIKT